MGKYDTCMREFLQNKERFADFFNGCCFQGEQVIRAEELQDASEMYIIENFPPEKKADEGADAKGHNSRQSQRKTQFFRDVKMYLCSGTALQILAVENQSYIDYSMPVRCMEYDAAEYHKQLKAKKRRWNLMNRRQKGSSIISGAASAATSHEKLSGILKTDRLQPVYTVCLYSGTDPWDGPRTLSDMMAFHPNDNCLRFLFRDYPLNLFCVNEHSGFDEFHTDLRQLFRAMNCRKDKQKLTELMGDKLYSHLNEDTWDAIAVMTDNAALLQNKEAFRNTYGNQEGFTMCQALDELMADKMNEGILIGKHEGILIGKHEGILIGKREGKHEGILLEKQNSEAKIRAIISNMLAGGISCENICRFLECDPSLVEQVQTGIQ